MPTEYQLMKDYADLGERLGFQGESLQAFINNLYREEKNKRAEDREAEKEAREKETENLRIQFLNNLRFKYFCSSPFRTEDLYPFSP